MSVFIDTLAEMIESSLDSDATEEDWEQALKQVYGTPQNLQPLAAQPSTYLIEWSIDEESSSPAEAAAEIWSTVFNRGRTQPSSEEACIFSITDRSTGATTTVDLSDEAFAHLFET